eukprot:GSMAST32.ASY1.ANO1.406.1 assembled CDS
MYSSTDVYQHNTRSHANEVMMGKAGVSTRRGGGLRDITNKVGSDKSASLAGVKPGVKKPSLRTKPEVDVVKKPTGESDATNVHDIDAGDRSNPQAVTEYVNDIFAYFRKIESRNGPSPTYMKDQPHINEKMRAILVDWLVEVHLKFKLMPETLFLTVNLIDRFLERKVVARQRLQLVGVTCMLLASKYEEIYFPEVRDFVYITDRAYKRDQILQMESLVLNTLGFELTVPTPICFLKRFIKAAKSNNQTQSWTPTLERYSRYKASELQTCADKIKEHILNTKSNLQAVRKKYTSSKFLRVALVPYAKNLSK